MKVFIGDYTLDVDRVVDIELDPSDTWSMDQTLSHIIAPMLKQLKENTHGAPDVDDEDVPDNLKSTSAPPFEEAITDENYFPRWDWVLDEMIWTFETLASDDWEDQFHTGEHDIVWVSIDADGTETPDGKYRRMDKGPNDTHVFDKEGWEACNQRIDNGTRLLGKYFRGLWD